MQPTRGGRGAGVIGRPRPGRGARPARGEVVLVDPDARARGARGWPAACSRRSPRPGRASEELLELGAASLARWPGFAAGRRRGRRPPGRAAARRARSPSPSTPPTARTSTARRPSCAPGPRRRRLTGRELRRSNPRSDPPCGPGCRCPTISPSTTALLLAALRAAARAGGRASCGPRPRCGCPTRAARSRRRRSSPTGRCSSAGRVVVAAGAWSATLHPALDGLVRPVKGEILRLRARAGVAPAARRAPCGPPSTAARCTRCPATTVGSSSAPRSTRSGSTPTSPSAGSATCSRDAERVLPGIARLRAGGDLGGVPARHRRQPPVIGAVPARPTACSSASGTAATACCSPP